MLKGSLFVQIILYKLQYYSIHYLSFRLYDKHGNGYITTNVLKEILKEIDSSLSEDNLEQVNSKAGCYVF